MNLIVPKESVQLYQTTEPWFRFHITSEDSAGADGISADEAVQVKRYTPDGIAISASSSGIQIVKMSDGSVRKVKR